jgi:hypothetical protein
MKPRHAAALALGAVLCRLTGCAADASNENYGAVYKTHTAEQVQGPSSYVDPTEQHCVNGYGFSSCFPTRREPQF